MPEKVLLVTGKLAAPLLADTMTRAKPDFAWEIAVMKISVAALMTPEWLARFLEVPPGTDLVLLPGRMQGDPALLREKFGVAVEKGPRELQEIPRYFGLAGVRAAYGAYDIRILAEIHNAASLTVEEVRQRAAYYAGESADVIDVGCSPGVAFPHLADVVRALRADGHSVSIDTFDAGEIRTAVGAGAELVLSVNGTNLEIARDLDATFVVIPDPGQGLDTLERNMERLAGWGVRYIADPILDPIGFGFADALARYHEVRRRHPSVEMLMGTANITELTDADTTGTNAVLIGFCQELGIRWILTTEDATWARGVVGEVDVARRLMHYAVTQRSLPKHVDPRLVTVKDQEIIAWQEPQLRALQAEITDLNFRIFTDRSRIYVFNAERFVSGTDIGELFAALDVQEPTHAFYLGKELLKAQLAITLGKTYRQEGQLSWGYLTPPEAAAPEQRAGDRENRVRVARERADRRRAAERHREQRRG